MTPELDPRWQWQEIQAFGEVSPRYVRTGCRHTEVVPVESVTGEAVAQLCLTCDGQLPPPPPQREIWGCQICGNDYERMTSAEHDRLDCKDRYLEWSREQFYRLPAALREGLKPLGG
jgi:hypothetical protein